MNKKIILALQIDVHECLITIAQGNKILLNEKVIKQQITAIDEIVWLLKNKADMKTVEAIAVVCTTNSFTSLRIMWCIAQALSFVYEMPVVILEQNIARNLDNNAAIYTSDNYASLLNKSNNSLSYL